MSNKSIISSQVSSLFQAVDISQQIPPLIVGERSNPTGSKKFRELLLADDFDGCLQVGIDQEEIGAHVVDLCAAWAGRDEVEDLTTLVQAYSQTLKAPLMIDSTNPLAIKAALESYPGKPIINSINLEDGGKTIREVLALSKKYGAALVALTIDQDGMAMTCDEKIRIAKEIHNIAVNEFGLKNEDLLFDTLTFTIGSGDETLKDAAIQTLDAIKRVKSDIPGAHTILGLSNISFGLPPAARRILNAVFLHEAVEAGLDAVIINPTNCIPLDSIDKESVSLALDLIYNRCDSEQETPLMKFIAHFETITEEQDDKDSSKEILLPEKLVHNAILKGNKDNLEDTLHMLLDKYSPLEIINTLLVPAMREVGELFGDGKMLLPFVLKSAEVMKIAVNNLEPFMEKSETDDSLKILLATVQGDVHDIGKNLVNIIFSNNGYQVIDIGIKAPVEKIIAAAKENNVDVIGLSGLLVKSAIVMQESMQAYKDAGLTQPILLGGAALTKKFVGTECAPHYDSPVIYCKDAFSGLTALQEFEKGVLQTTKWSAKTSTKELPEKAMSTITASEVIPKVPFFGAQELSVNTDDFLDLIKTNILFRGRWGYTRGALSKEEYQKLIKTEVVPQYNEIRERIISENLFEPKVQYGWFECQRNEDNLIVYHNDKEFVFPFPRQDKAPGLCLSDYFRTTDQDRDIVGLFVCTIGKKIDKLLHDLYDKDSYHEYFTLHGFSVEGAEALAELTHKWMRNQMGIQFSGERYSFGYSSCPDLNLQKPLFELLEAEKIGVSLTEEMQMVPEQSVSAVVVHHSQASYFSV